jgi:hypothetical protein
MRHDDAMYYNLDETSYVVVVVEAVVVVKEEGKMSSQSVNDDDKSVGQKNNDNGPCDLLLVREDVSLRGCEYSRMLDS